MRFINVMMCDNFDFNVGLCDFFGVRFRSWPVIFNYNKKIQIVIFLFLQICLDRDTCVPTGPNQAGKALLFPHADWLCHRRAQTVLQQHWWLRLAATDLGWRKYRVVLPCVAVRRPGGDATVLARWASLPRDPVPTGRSELDQAPAVESNARGRGVAGRLQAILLCVYHRLPGT